MRYVTFWQDEQRYIGVSTQDGVVNVTEAAAKLGLRFPESMEQLIASGAEGRQLVQQVLDAAVREGGPLLDETNLRFAPVVAKPEKIVCVGLNYRRHAHEAGMEVPEVPVYFPKYGNSLAGHGEDVVLPASAVENDYEVELAVVIGSPAKNVAVEDALDVVFGYAVANDLSARDLQMRTGQWMYGKAIDGFLPIGPWLVTADEVGDPQKLDLTCYVNGELRQSSNTADMVFSVAEIISDLSHIMTLKPGDIVITGTPEGVAMGLPSKPWLEHGDEVVCAIEKLGVLTNRMVRDE